MPPTTKEHLSRFAKTRDEQHFRAVVDDLGSLVISSAIRRTGDRELAEEITQNVFTILARKASKVAKYNSPTAWIHTTTKLESAKALRTRQRHQHKLAAVSETLSAHPDMTTEDHTAWKEALPSLEQALDHLSGSDREVILARFFKNQNYRTIAAESNSSEAACKMRTSRALEKLRTWMSRHGISLSSKAMIAGLASAWPEPLSATTISTISSKAILAAPQLTTGPLISNGLSTSPSLKSITIAAVAIVSLGSLAATWQASEIRSLEKQVAAKSTNPSTSGNSETFRPSAGFSESDRLGNLNVPDSPEELFEKLQRASLEQDSAAVLSLTAAISKLPLSDLRTLITKVSASDLRDDSKREIHSYLIPFLDLNEDNTPEMLNAYLQHIGAQYGFTEELGRWAAAEPNSALKWYHDTLSAGMIPDDKHLQNERSSEENILSAMLLGLIQSNPAKAVELLPKVSIIDVADNGFTPHSTLGRHLLQQEDENSFRHLKTMFDQDEYAGSLDGIWGVMMRKDRSGLPLQAIHSLIESFDLPVEKIQQFKWSALYNKSIPFADRVNWAVEHGNSDKELSYFLYSSGWKGKDGEAARWARALPPGPTKELAMKAVNKGIKEMEDRK